MADFVMSARTIKSGKFGDNPDKSRYLIVPDGQDPDPSQAITQKRWADAVVESTGQVVDGVRTGDILFFVHGANNQPAVVIARHRAIKDGLAARGFNGTLISFDWPAGSLALAYLDDRHDAVKSALQLVSDGIELLCAYKQPDCQVNIHVLAHSMGAFVVREAFADADNTGGVIGSCNWTVSQLLFISADVSMGSLSATDKDAVSLYRHAVRLTNYQNSHDRPLALSNVKRVGVAPRAGRHGLPDDAPAASVNVDCSDYWQTIPDARAMVADGDRSHSWQFNDPVFLQDVYYVLTGMDRGVMPTRLGTTRSNRFVLQAPTP